MAIGSVYGADIESMLSGENLEKTWTPTFSSFPTSEILRILQDLIQPVLGNEGMMGVQKNTNNLSLVTDIVDTLRADGLNVWVFGGWAEELRGVRQAGSHTDIDLSV